MLIMYQLVTYQTENVQYCSRSLYYVDLRSPWNTFGVAEVIMICAKAPVLRSLGDVLGDPIQQVVLRRLT